MRTAAWSESVSVLDRVCAILDAIDDPDGTVGVSEVARRANLPKSTVSRLLSELAVHRVVDRDDGGVSLGARLFEYAQGVQEPRRWRSHALPVLSDLRDATGLTAFVAVPHRSTALVVAVARGRHGSTPSLTVGSVLPSGSSAAGRALFADDVESRHAVSVETSDDGRASSLASPVCSTDGTRVAAVGVLCQGGRTASEVHSVAVRVAARTAGRRVGGEGAR